MSSPEQATQNQLRNIEARTGKSLAELTALVQNSGLSKHSEIRSMLTEQLGLGYGDASTLAHYAMQSEDERAAKAQGLPLDQALDEIYAGAKASQRPIHAKLVAAIEEFGPYETAPKKGYLSLRRKRQFAMLGPATNTRFELGLNMKNAGPSERLIEMPPGSMCNYKVRLTDPEQVDEELIAWVKQAYDSAG
jgi:hypothetical protein